MKCEILECSFWRQGILQCGGHMTYKTVLHAHEVRVDSEWTDSRHAGEKRSTEKRKLALSY